MGRRALRLLAVLLLSPLAPGCSVRSGEYEVDIREKPYLEGRRMIDADTGQDVLYEIYEAAMSDPGVVFLLDRQGAVLHSYNIEADRWMEAFPLDPDPSAMTVTADGDIIYISYPDGSIDTLDLWTGEQSVFATAPDNTIALQVAGDYLVAGGWSADGGSISVFDRTSGERVSGMDDVTVGRSLAFASGKGRLFAVTGDSGDSRPLALDIDPETGAVSPGPDFPYDGTLAALSPIRLTPDESELVTANGNFFDSEDLIHTRSLGLAYRDLRFDGSTIYLAAKIEGLSGWEGGEFEQFEPGTMLCAISDDCYVKQSWYFPGKPQRLFVHEHRVVLFTLLFGGPIQVYNLEDL